MGCNPPPLVLSRLNHFMWILTERNSCVSFQTRENEIEKLESVS